MPLPSPSSVLLRTQSDERLVVLARAGHERAFEAIVERYRGGLLRVARRYLPDARAEDALQQAFLAAWSALQRGDDVRDLGAWLHRIARNSALNQLRSTGYDYAELEESLRAADAPADALERRAAMRQTLTGLAALPERQREALLRIAVEGRSQDEVARELGVSSGAVRQLVHRARHTLRAAATAVVPMPVATWLASGAGATAEAVGGAGATALLAKGAAVVLATGVAAAPVIVAAKPDRPGHPPVRHAARPSDPSPSPALALPTASPSAGGGEHAASGGSERDRSGRSRSGRSGSGRSGKSQSQSPRKQAAPVATEAPRRDSSGPGPSSEPREDDSSGPGPSGGDDSSGHGSGDSSGHGSSGSGSSGSGSSGSGSGSSGSGSSGPGPGPTPAPTATTTPTATPDNSGPGSSGSGSSGSDNSGSGSSGSGSSGSQTSGSGSG